jgi:CHASE2 domain-containing sensor protein
VKSIVSVERLNKLRESRILRWLTALAAGLLFAGTVRWFAGEEFALREQARSYAPFAGWAYNSKAQRDITVLLIDDLSLSDAGQSWPATYSYTARLLNAIARYKPKAVFLDIYFSQERQDPTLPRLAEQLCALRSQGAQVYLGAIPGPDGQSSLRSGLDPLSGKCFEKVALHYVPDEIDRLAWTYSLAESGTKSSGAPLRSAALAMYEGAKGKRLDRDEYTMAMTWGLEPAQNGLRWLDPKAKHAKKESYCRESFGLAEVLPKGFLKLRYRDEAEKPVCVYSETLYAKDLSANSHEEEAALKDRIEGKTVLIGTALTDSADSVLTPMNGRIPGVFLHAMALDNLLTFEDRYPKIVPLFRKWYYPYWSAWALIAISVFIVSIVPREISDLWKAGPPERLMACNLFVWLYKAWRKLKQAVVNRLHWVKKSHPWWAIALALFGKGAGTVFKFMTAIAVGCFTLYLGAKWLHIGLLSIVSIVFFSMAAEWLELRDKAIEFLLRHEDSKPSGEPTEAPHQLHKEKAHGSLLERL